MLLAEGCSEQIGGAANTSASAVEHVGVDHSRLEVPVTEQLLNGSDVVAIRQHVGGEP